MLIFEECYLHDFKHFFVDNCKQNKEKRAFFSYKKKTVES